MACMLQVLALSFFLQIQPFDILIQHAHIVDGSGNPWYQGDIGVRGDTIVAIGLLEKAPSRLTIDAHGLTVAPGFIDIHTHARRGIFNRPAYQVSMLNALLPHPARFPSSMSPLASQSLQEKSV